jgi:hypothetical protein
MLLLLEYYVLFQTQSVTFEQVYQGCYTLGYIYTVDNKLTQKLITQYLKTSYKKEAAPCDETYITPINIRRWVDSVSSTPQHTFSYSCIYNCEFFSKMWKVFHITGQYF